MTYRIITDKAEAEQCLRDGGVLREGEELKFKWDFVDGELWLRIDHGERYRMTFTGDCWGGSTPGPFVVVREPPPKPLTDEQIVAELEKRAAHLTAAGASSSGPASAYREAARLLKERKL